MLIVHRNFQVGCSEKAAPYVMHIMKEHHFNIWSTKPYTPQERPDGPIKLYFECSANEEDLDLFMEHFSKVTFPVVTVRY